MTNQQDEQDVLDRVAAAISDGREVDWSGECTRFPGLANKLARLRRIESVAVAHRARAEQGSATRAVDSEAGSAAVSGMTTRTSGETDPGSTAPIPQTWGPLRIRARLSSGGFGDVFRAYDPKLQREVALKLARFGRREQPTAAKRFLEEARKLAGVRHPHVLTVHGVEEHDGRPGIWTDLIEGKTLAELFRDQGPLGDQEAASIGIVLCQALAALHGAGLLHRDIKPQNVMREQGGRLVLLDFGSVDTQRQEGEPAQDIEGTLMFMAPEIVLEKAPARVVSDIYSLGTLLFWLVSGRFPVEANTRQELHDAHVKGVRQRLRQVRPDLPLRFVQIVDRCVDPDPSRRIASVAELEQSLAGHSSVEQLQVDKRVPWFRSRRFQVAVVGAALALAGWLAYWLRPFHVDIDLYKESGDNAIALVEGASVAPGDRLFLQVWGTHAFHAYVFNEDELGERYALFPADSAQVTLIHGGRRTRLPPAKPGKSLFWEVSSVGGMETVLVVASRQRLPGLAEWVKRFPKPRRGVGKIVEEEDASIDPLTSWIDQIVAFYAKSGGDERPIIWKLKVENTGPPAP